MVAKLGPPSHSSQLESAKMAGAADGADPTKKSKFSTPDFPHYPGEDALAHSAALYLEQVEARLATHGLDLSDSAWRRALT